MIMSPKPQGGDLADLKIRMTRAQLEWLREQSAKTGNPIAAIIREMIQRQIDESGK